MSPEKIPNGDLPRKGKVDKNTYGSPATYRSLNHLCDEMDKLTNKQFYKLQKVIHKANSLILYIASISHYKTYATVWRLTRTEIMNDFKRIKEEVPNPALSLAENFVKTKFKRALEFKQRRVNKYGFIQWDINNKEKPPKYREELLAKERNPLEQIAFGIKRLLGFY